MSNLTAMNVYRLSSCVELTTGAALVFAPTIVMTLLFGPALGENTIYVAQLYGVAIISLGLTGWKKPCPITSKITLLFYNSAASIILCRFAISGIATGLMAWPAALLHLGIGLWMIKDRLSQQSN